MISKIIVSVRRLLVIECQAFASMEPSIMLDRLCQFLRDREKEDTIWCSVKGKRESHDLCFCVWSRVTVVSRSLSEKLENLKTSQIIDRFIYQFRRNRSQRCIFEGIAIKVWFAGTSGQLRDQGISLDWICWAKVKLSVRRFGVVKSDISIECEKCGFQIVLSCLIVWNDAIWKDWIETKVNWKSKVWFDRICESDW
jgi:macrodomain Ter protein organizer (MatP/YcbG family)